MSKFHGKTYDWISKDNINHINALLDISSQFNLANLTKSKNMCWYIHNHAFKRLLLCLHLPHPIEQLNCLTLSKKVRSTLMVHKSMHSHRDIDAQNQYKQQLITEDDRLVKEKVPLSISQYQVNNSTESRKLSLKKYIFQKGKFTPIR